MSPQWLDIGPLDRSFRCAARGPCRSPAARRSPCSAPAPTASTPWSTECPHKRGPLSQGIVHGDSVACPLHNWKISLATGEAQGADKGCVPTIPVQVGAGRVLICCARRR